MHGYVQTSPAAKRFGEDSTLSSGPTQRAPFLSKGTPSTNLVFGRTPAPMTTASHGRTSPSSSSTPFTSSTPLKSRTWAVPYHSTPSFWSSRAKEAPTFLPSTRSNGTVSIATTDTSQPFFFSAEAISMPMKEPPTTMIFIPFFAYLAISAASSGVRSVWMPLRLAPGQKSFLGEPPVATSAESYFSTVRVSDPPVVKCTSLALGSNLVTLASLRTSMPYLSKNSADLSCNFSTVAPGFFDN
mmetsp:Transcript_26357/g.87353  ORF Transcript_26357/g.87353 Transcript_26357/m.87353 type:complete len:242 (-) Transcript_26357:890-1615(-)